MGFLCDSLGLIMGGWLGGLTIKRHLGMEEAGQAVVLPCQELEEQLKDEPVLNLDETGWRTNGDKRYLWAFVALRFVVYTVAGRGSEVLVRLLGAVFRGVLYSDHFSAYLKYHSGPSAVLLGASQSEIYWAPPLSATRYTVTDPNSPNCYGFAYFLSCTALASPAGSARRSPACL